MCESMGIYDDDFACESHENVVVTVSFGVTQERSIESHMGILNDQAAKFHRALMELERDITEIVCNAFGVQKTGDDWDTNKFDVVELVRLLAKSYKEIRDENSIEVTHDKKQKH